MLSWVRGSALAVGVPALMLLTACGDGPPEAAPPTSPPPTVRPPTTEGSSPISPTAVEGPPVVEGPPGAGLIEPLHEFFLETSIDELEPGDYAVIWNLLASEEAGFEIYDYADLAGDRSEPFFQIVPVLQEGAIVEVVSIDRGRILAQSEGEGPAAANTLLAFIDQGEQTFQFALDGEARCRLPRTPGFAGERFFGYPCEDNDGSRTWYAVEFADWSFAAEVTLPDDVRIKGWLSPETAYFGSPFEYNQSSFQHCTASSPDWELQCVEYPSWLGALNSLETSFWAWPGAIDFYDSAPLIVNAECILEMRPECDFLGVDPPAEFRDDFTADLAAVAWSPSSEQLVTVAADCRDDRTRIWYWDFQQEMPIVVGEIDGCYSQPQVGPLWDSSGRSLILDSGEVDKTPVLISLNGEIGDLLVPGAAVGVVNQP